MCYKSVSPECHFGILAPSMLPPQAVSTTRHAVALETLIGSQPRRRETVSRELSSSCHFDDWQRSSLFLHAARSISEDFSSGGGDPKSRESEEFCQGRERDRSRERDDRDEGQHFLSSSAPILDSFCSIISTRMNRTHQSLRWQHLIPSPQLQVDLSTSTHQCGTTSRSRHVGIPSNRRSR